MELIIDWVWLYIQIFLLFIIIAKEVKKPSGRNIYAIIISITMLVLVQFQAWWVLDKFQNPTGGMRHIEQWLSLEGIRLANFYAGLATIAMFVTYSLLPNKTYSTDPEIDRKKNISAFPSQPELSKISTLIIWVWTIVCSILLVSILGGLQSAIDNPGNVVGGQTMLLIAVSLGKIPLIRKVETQQRINFYDIFLFGYTFIVTLFNSRFSATFILIQLLLISNYCRKEVSRSSLVVGAVLAVAIFFGFGVYRDNASMNEGATIAEKINLWTTKLGNEDDSPIEWFYRVGVEGFTGLAGILTYEKSVGGIRYDFGLSNFSFFTQLVPNFIRTDSNSVINQISNFFNNTYPYPNGSIVVPGLEASYAHFGIFGIVLFGITLGYLMWFFHDNMINEKQHKLLIALISIQSALYIRSMIKVVLFFGIGDFVILALYQKIASLNKRILAKS